MHQDTMVSEIGNARRAQSDAAGGRTAVDGVCALMFVADVGAFVVAVALGLIAMMLFSQDGTGTTASFIWATLQSTVPELVLIASGVGIYFLAKRHYASRRPFWTESREIVLAGIAALLVTSFMELVFRRASSRQLLVATWTIFPVAVIAARVLVRSVLDRLGLWSLDVVLVGDAASTRNAEAALLSERLLGYRIVGRYEVEQLLALRTDRRFEQVLRAHNARQLVLAVNVGSGLGRRLVRTVLQERVPFSLVPQLETLPVFGYDQVAFFSHDSVLLSYKNNLADPTSRCVKAAFDIVAATFLLMFLAFPMLVIAFLVSRDGGPVLFSHQRIGAGGRPFQCLKFRTMKADSQHLLDELLARDPQARAEWEATQKLRNDPRVNRIGRLLRVTSLDELPQLLNVLRLEMSLVGPRPIVSKEIEKYADDISYYYEARPGLTGLWQVSGRSDTSYGRRVQLDSWYVRNWTIWHDIAILLKTVPAVLSRQGAR